MERATNKKQGATVFAYQVFNPEKSGVVEFDKHGKVLSIEEKPEHPKSNWAIIGLYFYDNNAIEYAKSLEKSERNEYEITDLHKKYLEKGNLRIEKLGRGFSWLDTGDEESLTDAIAFVNIQQKIHPSRIACIEEIAYDKGWIGKEQLEKLAQSLRNSKYGQYLLSLLK